MKTMFTKVTSIGAAALTLAACGGGGGSGTVVDNGDFNNLQPGQVGVADVPGGASALNGADQFTTAAAANIAGTIYEGCLLYTSPSPRD